MYSDVWRSKSSDRDFSKTGGKILKLTFAMNFVNPPFKIIFRSQNILSMGSMIFKQKHLGWKILLSKIASYAQIWVGEPNFLDFFESI